MSPQRIQRRRTKGWRMPKGAVYVGRPTKWGNPESIGTPHPLTGEPMDAEEVTWRYRQYSSPMSVYDIRAELQGRDLVCWCPLDRPCHADVLLELANV